ncbi:MAG TPA: amidohydrolase, partial [Bacillota bacterium]|nr:amidohydrolase [Bacillota bacterium]
TDNFAKAATDVFDAHGMLAIPGLINCHTHSYMSLFKNIADDLPFDEWLFGRIMPLEDRMTADDAYWCTLLSCAEMLRRGTTCFADMHMFESMCAKAAVDAGMRAVMCRGLTDTDGTEGGLRRLREAENDMEAFRSNGMLTHMLAPHAIYTCSNDYLKSVIAEAKLLGVGLHTHLSETQYEFDTCMKQHGMTPCAYLESIGFFDLPVIAAHCVYLTDEDIGILKKHDVTVITNPKSNLKLANGIAPVEKLRKASVRVAIGTDGSSSNNALNMFSEMNMLALLQKGLTKDPTAAPAQYVFNCATQSGADALGIDSGLLAPGKNADIVLLDMKRPQLIPLNDPESALVYSADGSETDSVFIGGKPVLLRGVLQSIDENFVFEKVKAIISKLTEKN